MNILTNLTNAVANALGYSTPTTAVIRSEAGDRIVAKFNTPEEKQEWLEFLDESTPSDVSYYDAITNAINSQED